MQRAASITSAVLTLLLAGCASVPITGRNQLHLIPSEQMLSISVENYRTMREEKEVVRGTDEARMVERVGRRIARAVERYAEEHGWAERIADYEWQFTLFRDDAENAWCMPGGKVGVYTGILDVTQNEAGLAVVMGHEIAHAVAAHGNERMSQQLTAQLGGIALAVALREKPARTRQLFYAAYGVGSQVAVLLPYSRLHESEADQMGLYFMAMAGYDPHEAVDFWQRMEQRSGSRPPVFLSTHPAHEGRIENLRGHMDRAEELYRQHKR